MPAAPFDTDAMPRVLADALESSLLALCRAGDRPQINRLSELQRRYAGELQALWRSTLSTDRSPRPETPFAAAQDPRFKDEAWREDGYFDLLRQSYLTGASYLHDLVAALDVDERTRQKLRFATRQFTDACCPTNYLATNPEALALARETNGKSVVAGLQNLAADIARGQVTTTDRGAFEVGRNLAATEGAVVFENELFQLIQYAPTTAIVDAQPLLVVPPCINRFYVLDLQPENSFVRFAIDQGFTVFLISWRSATKEVADLTWDDYLAHGVLAASDVVRSITQERAHALGFCIGGTLLACAAAFSRMRDEDRFASLTLLTTLLDFSDTGEIGLLVDPALVAMREASIGRGGLLYGAELTSVFSALRANDLLWPYVIDNYLKGGTPAPFDILFWNADSANLPGPMICWYLRRAYLENAIKTPGGTMQCGVPIDLSAIDAPTYLLAARDDHIVPWTAAFATTHLIAGESRFVLGASGHIAGVINPASRNRRSYWVDGDQGIGPQTWLRTAREVAGSWWTDWSGWLKSRSGGHVMARADLGSADFRVIEPAPGRYVRMAAEKPVVM